MYRCRYTMYTSINLLKIMHHCRYALHNPSRDTYLPLELHHHTKRINLKWILLFCFHVKPQLAPRIKFSSLNETAATLTMYDLINYKYISSHPIMCGSKYIIFQSGSWNLPTWIRITAISHGFIIILAKICKINSIFYQKIWKKRCVKKVLI